MAGNEGSPPVRVTERIGGTRITMSLAEYRARLDPAPAPPGDDVLRTGRDSVELIMSKAGVSRRALRAEAVAAVTPALFLALLASMFLFTIALVFATVAGPGLTLGGVFLVAALPSGSAMLLGFVVCMFQLLPSALRISFVPATGPAQVGVVRWWRTRRIPLSALSGITVIEFRYRPPGQAAAGDARRETVSDLPYRVDAVLHRTGGGSWTVRGASSRGWRPDPRDVYGLLTNLLAPAGVAIDRQVVWTDGPLSGGGVRWFSPGSGGANGLGGGC